jgi:hypothetical protein
MTVFSLDQTLWVRSWVFWVWPHAVAKPMTLKVQLWFPFGVLFVAAMHQMRALPAFCTAPVHAAPSQEESASQPKSF